MTATSPTSTSCAVLHHRVDARAVQAADGVGGGGRNTVERVKSHGGSDNDDDDDYDGFNGSKRDNVHVDRITASAAAGVAAAGVGRTGEDSVIAGGTGTSATTTGGEGGGERGRGVDVKPRRYKSKRTQSRLLSKFSTRNRAATTTTTTATDADTGSGCATGTGRATAVTDEKAKTTTTTTSTSASNNTPTATPFFFKHKSKYKHDINVKTKAKTKSKSKIRKKPNPDISINDTCSSPSPPAAHDDEDDPLLFSEDAALLQSLRVLWHVRSALRVLDERAQGHCDALLMAARTQRALGVTMSDMVEPFLLTASSACSSGSSCDDDGEQKGNENEREMGEVEERDGDDENDGNLMNECVFDKENKKKKKNTKNSVKFNNNKKDDDNTDNNVLKSRRITTTLCSPSSTHGQTSSLSPAIEQNDPSSPSLPLPHSHHDHHHNHHDLLLQSALGRGLRHVSGSAGHQLSNSIGRPISQLRSSFEERYARKIIPLLELYAEQKQAYLKYVNKKGEYVKALMEAMKPVWMRTSTRLRAEADVMACLTMRRVARWVKGVTSQQERALAVAAANMKEAFERARGAITGSGIGTGTGTGEEEEKKVMFGVDGGGNGGDEQHVLTAARPRQQWGV